MSKKKNYPVVSVILPVYNDPEGLKDTLMSLVVQDFPPKDFEIIVVDNGSKDNTFRVAKEIEEKYPELIRVLTEDEVQSSYAARNKGVKNSRGSIIAFIDADMSVDEDWLLKIVKLLEKHQADCLGCKVEIYSKDKTIFGLYNKMTDFDIETCVKKRHMIPAGFLTVRRNVFKKVGFFDSRLISYGDLEFGKRMYEAGFKFHYEPNIVMKHPARSSLQELLKKYFRIGRGVRQLVFYIKRFRAARKNLFNPIHYLPPNPWKFSNVMKEKEIWKGSSPIRKIGFFLILWSCRAAKHIGYIYECLRGKK